MQNYFVAFLLSIIILPSLLLRYLPFRPFLTHEQNKRLGYWYVAWFLVLYGIDLYVLQNWGISLKLFKLSVMLGWLPYLLINILCIPHHLEHHLFVAGMQTMYVMLIHGAGVLILLALVPNYDLVQFCYIQTSLFLLIFAATYPLIKHFFDRVFLARHAISDRSYWRSVCLLPMLIVGDLVYLSYSDSVLALELLVPRLILLPTFVVLMHAFSYDVTRLEDQASADANNKFLSMQLSSLKEHTSLMEENNRKMSVFRHDIRHYNRLLYTLIKEDKYEAALSFITDCDANINQTAVQPYCSSPILNAALAIYIRKAEQEQIPLAHKIELPAVLPLDENELAVLFCNLLENAFRASYKQPAADRSIKVIARLENNHLLFMVANRFQDQVALGKDGLPVTYKQGHGLGMRSLAAFRDKYGATVLCSQNEGWFRTMIYVTEKK
jgi:signal transduction histidine kinase